MSETGVSFAMHFCGDKLVSAQLNMGQENGGCDMDNSDCESTNSTVSKSNCCVNMEEERFSTKTPFVSKGALLFVARTFLKYTS